MNKFLSLECLSELPFTIRDLAIPAAHGSLADMEHLSRLIHGDPNARDTFMACLCVLYANLDPLAIPRDGGPPGIPGALAVSSLKCLRLLGPPLDTSAHFWPRIWGWTHFISSHPEQFPPEPTGMDICIDVLLFVDALIVKEVHGADLTANSRAYEMINRTPGVRTLLARAWAQMSRDKKKQPTRDNMSALSRILTLLDFTKDSAHLQEAIDGAGGSLNDFARLITGYIDSIVPTSRVDLSADQYGLLNCIFYPVRGLCAGSQAAQDALPRAGFVASLTRMMCALARYSGPRIWAHDESLVSFTGDDDLMGTAVILMVKMLKSPRHTGISRDAISEGLLRAIVSYGIRGAEVEWTSKLVATLSSETIHYTVVSRLERALRDTSDITAHPAFKKSANFAAWNTFRDLAVKRIAVAKLWKSPDSLSRKACDNMECGDIRKKEDFKACGQCRRVYYCTRSCQKLDWQQGHRNECASMRAFSEKNPDPLSSEDVAFIKELVHNDYVSNMHKILSLQVDLVRQYPSWPFITVFDYCAGTVNLFIDIRPDPSMEEYTSVNWAEHGPRVSRSGGRMDLHIAAGKFTRNSEVQFRMFPMRSNSSILHDGVRRLARMSLYPAELSREVAKLIKSAMGTVQIH
ncbi:hypothetical protein B0H11DRAFT_2292758 [Mycena galericulata]|nr:hypothetical protein B0H11DRAFT_2292758 [Mycena galericulata]